MAKIAFLGLGVMGYPMAGHLATAGHKVTVYNRTYSKAEKWNSEFKGSIADTPYTAVKDADFVMSCVGNDKDLLDITIGEQGAFSEMKKGALFIDHTTVSAQVTEKLYKKSQELVLGLLMLLFPVGKQVQKTVCCQLCVAGMKKIINWLNRS